MKIDLGQIEALAKAATPGPWHIGHINEFTDIGMVESQDGYPVAGVSKRSNEAYFCLMNPQTTLELVAVVREMREALEFYGDKFYWEHLDGDSKENPSLGTDGREYICPIESSILACDAGQKAREVLEKYFKK